MTSTSEEDRLSTLAATMARGSRSYNGSFQVFITPALHDVTEHADQDYRDLVRASVALQRPTENNMGTDKVRFNNISKAMKADLVNSMLGSKVQDDERGLRMVRERLERAGMIPASVTVKFRNVTVATEVSIGKRSLPTLTNAVRDVAEEALGLVLRNRGGSKRKFVMLNDVSGCLPAGRCTLLLGPPGAGKSTLMKYLAGQLGDDSVTVSKAHFTYNGKKPSEFHINRSAAYIDQEDRHIAELTVRETLEFSQSCQGPGANKIVTDALADKEREQGVQPDPDIKLFMDLATHKQLRHNNILASTIIKILGLDICENTVIGSEMLKGVSGGQRKRVTTGEMIVGPIKVLFMDEISTGLDSATTYSISRTLVSLCRHLNYTILVALLQPTPETFDLFDDLMLMAEGRIIYHGPLKETLAFFKTMGFECPERKAVADFVQEVTSKMEQQQYWVGDTPYKYVNVASFAAAYKRSQWGQAQQTLLDAPDDPSDIDMLPLWDKKYSLPHSTLLWRLICRESLLMKRQSVFIIAKLVQIGMMAFTVATTFMHTNIETEMDSNLYLGVLFLSVLYMGLGGMSELPFVCSALPVYYKQRNARFYPSWAWAISTTLVKIPPNIVEAMLWTVVVYFALPYTPTAGQFFMFLAILSVANISSTIQFRTIACFARDEVLAQAMGSVVLMLTINTAGFVITKTDMRPYFIWLYWISPLTWALRGLSINELTSQRWDQPAAFFPGLTMGEASLEMKGMPTQYFWAWLALAYLGGVAAVCMCLQFAALKWLSRPASKHSLSEDQLNQQHEDAVHITVPNTFSFTELDNPPSKPLVTPPHAVAESTQVEVVVRPCTPEQEAALFSTGADTAAPRSAQSASSDPNNNWAVPVTPTDAVTRVKQKSRLPFTPLNMVFKQIVYTVQLPGGKPGEQLTLLNGISGLFRPGVLTALMGASGAGKTTLMDVLAGRKTGGVINGDVLVNGYKKVQATFNRIMGYVEQFDVHSPCSTIYEALLFSARMRLECADMQAVNNFVEEVMELVELTPLRNAVIGLPGRGGLSIEQRKRHTIAVELVANPSIVFMDEPTSGLDARAAAIVMRVVRNTVNTGRTVVCTIHQPSLDIFEAFDELLLLKRGGKTIFFGNMGPQQATLIGHFESVQGVAPFKTGTNPANWMLEVSAPGAEANLGLDFADIYEKSDLAVAANHLIEQLSRPAAGVADISFKGGHALGQWRQFWMLLQRFNTTYWRMPNYNLVRIVTTLGFALFYGALFWDRGQASGPYISVGSIGNIMGALYAATCFIAITNAMTVMPVIQEERAVFYRERASGYYSEMPYGQAQGLIELPYITLQTFLFSIIFYWMVGFKADVAKFFLFVLYFFLLLVFFTDFGIMAILITPSVQFGTVVIAFIMGFWNLFCGFLISQPDIPGWWVWVYYSNPLQYAIQGLVCGQLCDNTQQSVVVNLANPAASNVGSVQQYLEHNMGFKQSFLGWIVLILIGFIIAARFTCQLALLKLNFQHR